MTYRRWILGGFAVLLACGSFAWLNSSAAQAQVPSPVTLTKTHTVPAIPGINIAYTITADNTGVVSATATLTDPLPPQTTFVALASPGGWTCTTPAVGAGGTVTCDNTNFLPGPAVFTISVRILPSVTNTFTNTANITGEANGRPYNVSASDPTPVTPDSLIGITKTGPATVLPGANISYTVTLNQLGPSDATAVTWDDTLPANVTFVSLSSVVGWSCTTPAVGAAGTINCTAASFLAGTSAVFTLVGRVSDLAPPGQLSNTANVGQNSSTAATTVLPPSADLSITKIDTPDPVAAGANLTYTINLTNNGPSAATSATITDQTPVGTTFVSMAAPVGYTCTTPAVFTTGQVQCTSAPSLASGATSTFTLIVRPNSILADGTVITNTVTGDATTPDPTPLPTATATTTVRNAADLSLTKTDSPDPVAFGGNVTYAMTVTNSGPLAASSVTMNDFFPQYTNFVSLAAPPGWTCITPAVGSFGALNCTIASLANGAVASFTVVVSVSPNAINGMNLPNTATVSAQSPPDLVPGNNSATTTTLVTRNADISITKIDTPDPVLAGGNLTYTLTVSNSGPQPAPNVRLTDVLPANTTFVSLATPAGWTCTTPAAGAAGTMQCDNVSFAAASPAVFTLVVQVSAATPDGTTISNTAAVALRDILTTPATAPATQGAPADDPNPANNTATATTTVGTGADLAVQKTASPPSATPGSNVTYTVTLTNNGPSLAANVSLSDPLPSGTTLVSATQTSGPAFTIGAPPVGSRGTVTMTAPSLANGASAAFSIVVKLPLVASGTIANVATVTSSTADPNVANNTATATTSPGQLRTDIAVTKTGTPDAVTPGRDITYTLTVSNLGTDDALNVTLVDTLPANVSFTSWVQTSGPSFSCTLPAAGASGAVNCTIASLAAKATATFSLGVHVNSAPLGPSIVNVANVTTTSIDTNPANNTASVTTMGVGQGIPQIFQNPGAIAIVGQQPPRTPTPRAVSPAASLPPAIVPVITPPRTGNAGLKAVD